MFNVYRTIRDAPHLFNQLIYDNLLFAEYKCPIMEKKKAMWSENNHLVYVLKGRKTWHTPFGSWDLHEGDCILIKKGAYIIEQFFDEDFCLMAFFFPDTFVRKSLQEVTDPAVLPVNAEPVIRVKTNENLTAFFLSMIPYFAHPGTVNKSLVALKFMELILNLYTSPDNSQSASYFFYIKKHPKPSLLETMETNFSYNMEVSEYAELCCMSLSSFKRKFKEIYQTSPQRWLTLKRLGYAKFLLETTEKSVTEIIFESGFENLSHFSKIFKEHFQDSPQHYREKMISS